MECHPADLVRHTLRSVPEVTRTSGKTEIYSYLYPRVNHHPEETNTTHVHQSIDIEIYIFHHHHIYIIYIYILSIYSMWNNILLRWGLLSFSTPPRRQRRQRQRQRRSSFAVAAAEAAVPRPETARDISSLSPPQEEEQRVDRRTNPPPAPPLPLPPHRTLEQRAPPPLIPPPLPILSPLIVTLSPTIIHCTSSSPPSSGRCHSHPNDHHHRSDFRFQLRDYGGGGVTPPRLYDHLHNQYDHRPSLPAPPLPRVNPVLPTDGNAVTRRDRPLTTAITSAPTNNNNNGNNMRGRSRSQPPPLPAPSSRNVSQKKKKIRSFWLTADLYHSIQWLQRENMYIIGSIVHSSARALFLQESWSCVVQSSLTSSIASTSLHHSSIYLQTLPYFIAHTVPRGQYTEQWVCQYILYPLCQILQACHHTCRMIHGNLHLNHILIHPLTYQMSICGLQYAIPLPSTTTSSTRENGTSPSPSPPVVVPHCYNHPHRDERRYDWYAFRAPELESVTVLLNHDDDEEEEDTEDDHTTTTTTTTAIDIWALGIVLYMCFSGGLAPFRGSGPTLIRNKARARIIPLHQYYTSTTNQNRTTNNDTTNPNQNTTHHDHDYHRTVSTLTSPELPLDHDLDDDDDHEPQQPSVYVQDLIQQLIQRSPKRRLSIDQILQHDWFRYYYHPPVEEENDRTTTRVPQVVLVGEEDPPQYHGNNNNNEPDSTTTGVHDDEDDNNSSGRNNNNRSRRRKETTTSSIPNMNLSLAQLLFQDW
jgi:serine/threonine protein kinase